MPTSFNAVVVLVLFIIPGFIFTRVFGFSVPLRTRDSTYTVLDSLAVSSVNYAFWSPLVLLLIRPGFSLNHPVWFPIGWFGILFLSPVLLAAVAVRFIDSPRAKWLRRSLRMIHPIPKAWDHFFRQGKICWVMATMKDGRLVAGLFSTNSFASSYPDEEDIYLETLCTLSPEGKITGIVKGSEGAILRMDDVLLLEFYSS
jgi:uncharacterized protein DUF6338